MPNKSFTLRDWYPRLLSWREQHIKEKQFILILSFLVGIGTGLVAFVLKSTIHLIQGVVTSLFAADELNYWYLALPAVGITLASLFVHYVVKDDISHGVTKILYAISQHKAIIKLHNIWSSVVASAITIGFGGSVGAEAPIVLTGSAIGSNLGRMFKLDQKTLMLLVGCGAAGAIGGIFKAPIAGVAFTMEVLLLDLTMTSIAPLLITAVTATAMSYFLMGNEVMFRFDTYEAFSLERIPYLILLGVVCGLVSLYFTRGMNWLEGRFKKITKAYQKIVVGGIMLSVLIFFFPPLYGEGYDTITALLAGNSDFVFNHSLLYDYRSEVWAIVLYLSAIIFFKIFASAATNGAGGTGGIFAPSLFVGCITGFVVAIGLNFVGIYIPNQNFAFAGMAGLMSGVMHAPLTSTFLIAELTGGYDLFMTLIITSVVSYLTIIVFEPHSLYAMRLAKKGKLLTHHKDRAVLTLLKMENVIETDLEVIHPEMTLGELVKVISRSNRNIFPVVKKKTGVLVGILPLDEVRNIMFRPELYSRFTVHKLMIAIPAKININMPMEKVMDVFEDTGAWNLPVVDDQGKYVGFVSKSKIFNSYRRVLVHFSEE
ncbi:MAG TPA: chloride channel protein [Paludibacteraceae bacterium]|nr:chloride channel protein [Paludibacteraceae bacterium]